MEILEDSDPQPQAEPDGLFSQALQYRMKDMSAVITSETREKLDKAYKFPVLLGTIPPDQKKDMPKFKGRQP